MDAAAPLEIGVETLTLHRAFSMLNVILLKLFGNQSTSATETLVLLSGRDHHRSLVQILTVLTQTIEYQLVAGQYRPERCENGSKMEISENAMSITDSANQIEEIKCIPVNEIDEGEWRNRLWMRFREFGFLWE